MILPFQSVWVFFVVVAVWAFSSHGKCGLLSNCSVGFSFRWLLLLPSMVSSVQASIVAAHGLSWHVGSWYLGQGLKPCPLHWQMDPQSLEHQGSPPFQSVDIINYINYIRLLKVQPVLHSQGKLLVMICYPFLCCCIQFTNILFFTLSFIICIDLQFFFSYYVFGWFWYQGNAGLMKGVGKISLFLCFLEDSEFFLKCLVKCTSEGIWACSFLCRKI